MLAGAAQCEPGVELVKRLFAVLPTATQSVPCGHETDVGDTSPAPLLSAHPPDAGVVLVKTSPALSTPTHSAAVGQLIAVGGFESAAVGAPHVGGEIGRAS